MPAELGDLSALTSLSLHNNSLVGPLPLELSSLKQLQHFSCDLLPYPTGEEFDKINDYIAMQSSGANIVTGDTSRGYTSTIAEERVTLLEVANVFGGDALVSSLQWSFDNSSWSGVHFDHHGCVRSLILPDCGLTAGVDQAFPASVEYLSNVVYLDLSDNCLGGSLPKEIFCLAHLQYLYLNNNQLEGNIRPDICNPEGLKTLNLANNRLTGQLPTCISTLCDLEIFNLSNNHLDGEIYLLC